MSVKLSCLARCLASQNAVDFIESFNEKFSDYLNRAVAGENPYKLEIDKKWANFIYKSSKMTLIKFLTIFITIAPSFTKIFSTLTTAPVIKGCYIWPNTNEPLSFAECLEYNGNSPILKNYLKIDFSSWKEPLAAAVIMFFFSVPHLCFMGIVWWRFSINKYTVWISAAKIHLPTLDKRGLTIIYYALLALQIFLIYSFCEAMAQWTDMKNEYSVPYINQKDLVFIFEKTNASSPLALLSTGLVYSCLLTVLFAQIRQPMSLFSGFRQYLKKASRVPYNIWTVDYRIESHPITWKFIKRYYQECERYDRRVVLIAMVTHFLDLELLKVEGSEYENDRSPTSIKVN